MYGKVVFLGGGRGHDFRRHGRPCCRTCACGYQYPHSSHHQHAVSHRCGSGQPVEFQAALCKSKRSVFQGGIQNLQLLSRKDAQVSFAITSITYQAMKGLDKFRGHAYPDVRIIAGLYYNPNQVIARADSNVAVLKDFKGKTFAPGVAGGTTIGEAMIHFKAAGLAYPGDIRPQYVGPTEAGDLMRNKQLDGAWIMAGLPNAGVSEMCTTADGRLVNIDDATFEKIAKDYPWYAKFPIPAGTYPGQDETVQTTAVKMILITDASLPEDVVYDLTRCFWENQDVVKQSHAVMKGIDIAGAVTDLAGIPLHPGAARYYRERGVLK